MVFVYSLFLLRAFPPARFSNRAGMAPPAARDRVRLLGRRNPSFAPPYELCQLCHVVKKKVYKEFEIITVRSTPQIPNSIGSWNSSSGSQFSSRRLLSTIFQYFHLSLLRYETSGFSFINIQMLGQSNHFSLNL